MKEPPRAGAENPVQDFEQLHDLEPAPPSINEPSKTPDHFQDLSNLENSQKSKLLRFKAKIGRCHADAILLVDSGASDNFVASSFIKKNQIQVSPVQGPKVQLADGQIYQCSESLAKASLKIGPYQEFVAAHVLPLQGYDVILGKSWLEQHNPVIDWRENTMTLDCEGHQCTLRADHDHERDRCGMMSLLQLSRAIQKGAESFLCILRPVSSQSQNPVDPQNPQNPQNPQKSEKSEKSETPENPQNPQFSKNCQSWC